MTKKETCLDFIKMKKEEEQIARIIAYNSPTSSFVE